MSAAATAPPRRADRASARRAAPRGRSAPPGRIRWDRVGRVALLAVLGIILLLYISPLSNWLAQSRTADAQRTELRRLERENARLSARARELARPDALEREARRLGMVRHGERPYVIRNAR